MKEFNLRYFTTFAYSALLLIVVIVYAMMLSSISMNFHPIWSDEFFYWANAKSFMQNGSLEAAFTYSGKGSLLFGADAHGFAYPLCNGIFAKIIGNVSYSFIVWNILLIISAIVGVFSLKTLSVESKLWIITVILIFPFLPLYAFTFMQESIHVFFAICLSVLFYQIRNATFYKPYLLSFVLVILIAGMFRSLWFFWLIGLLPIARSRRELKIFGFIFIIGIFCSFCVNYYFNEPVPNFFTASLNLIRQGEVPFFIKSLGINFYMNYKYYFFTYNDSVIYFLLKYMVFCAFLFVTFKAIKYRQKTFVALSLIGLVNFGLLFFFYEANYWKEIRTMSPLFYFYLLFIAEVFDSKSKFLLVFAMCIIFGFSINLSKQWIAQRNESQHISLNVINHLIKLQQYIPAYKIVKVEYLPDNELQYLSYLPLENRNHRSIKYIIPFYAVKEAPFHYIIKAPAAISHEKVVFKNNYFSLIKAE